MPCYDSRTSSTQYIPDPGKDQAIKRLSEANDHSTRVACALYRFAREKGLLVDDKDVQSWWAVHEQDDLKREAEARIEAIASERERCARAAASRVREVSNASDQDAAYEMNIQNGTALAILEEITGGK